VSKALIAESPIIFTPSELSRGETKSYVEKFEKR